MPSANQLLPSFIRRDVFDHVMFGYVWGVRSGVIRALPGVAESDPGAVKAVSIEAAVAMFAKDFGLTPEQFNVRVQSIRYQRMVHDYYRMQRELAHAT